MENSYDEECFKKWEIDECEAEMEKVVQWIGVIQQIKHCLFRHIKTGLL